MLKFLQIMTEKKLVRRTETGRTHVYEPMVTEETTQRRMVSDLMDRAFGGSAARLVMQALSTKPTSPEELREIRRLLDGLNGPSPEGAGDPG